MNCWNGTGNLGFDPELKRTPSGGSVLNLRVAVDRTFRRKMADGSVKYDKATDWIDVVVWGHLAEVNAKYLQKGSKIGVRGELRTRSYEDSQGNMKYVTEVHADEIEWHSRIKSKDEAEATATELD